MDFRHDGRGITCDIGRLIVAGWTGRDRAGIDHHIAELAEIGVSPPSEVPLFYRVSRGLLTQDDTIEVLGAATSGEAEPLLLHARGELWLGLASDHTDRELETYSVAASKQACAKPVAPDLWRFADVADGADALRLTCEIEEDGAWREYQDGALDKILPLRQLAAMAGLRDGDAMLCGTLPVIGGIRAARRYRMALRDEAADKTIRLEYAAQALPVRA